MSAPVPNPRAPKRTQWRRRGLIVFGPALSVYVGLIVVLLLLENSLVYFPLRASDDWRPPPIEQVRDVEVRLEDGTGIHAWWCPTPEARGALILCHGNGGNLSHRGELVRTLQRTLNVSVLIFDYPGYGKSEGKPSEQGCYRSAEAAYAWLTEEARVQPEEVLFFGESLGGGVAVDLASKRPHRALILVNTFTSIPDVAQQQYPWLPVWWLVRNRFENLTKIGQCTRPVFIANATEDRIIPFSHGERLFRAAHEPKQFFRLEGADHNDWLPLPFYEAVRTFLAKTGGG